jgi:hypothetical protein
LSDSDPSGGFREEKFSGSSLLLFRCIDENFLGIYNPASGGTNHLPRAFPWRDLR